MAALHLGSATAGSGQRMSFRRFPAIVAAGFFALASPALAVTDDAALQQTSFATTFTERYEVGSYTGVLKLTIGKDGVVSGFYRNQDAGRFETVTGGLDGDQIHLDFDFNGRVHIDGTYDGKSISGSTLVGGRVYYFVASPQTS